jgi:hypothetical protein
MVFTDLAPSCFKTLFNYLSRTSLVYLEGHISSGDRFSASPISRSPFGQCRANALPNVEEASPASLDTADNVVPFFFKAAITSAGCQSRLSIMLNPPGYLKV